jgi:hypothetical protein
MYKKLLVLQKSGRIFIALCLIVMSYPCLAQVREWKKVSIADSITVSFPGKPTEKLTQNKLGQVKVYVFKDGTGIYTAMVQESPIEPESSDAEIQKFYQGILQGLGGKILNQKTFVVNGFKGVEAQFTTPSHPELPATKFLKAVVVNGTVYLQQFWTDSKQENEVNFARSYFFSSFRPDVDKVDQVAVDVHTDTFAYRVGKLLGTLMFYGFLIFVVVKVLRGFRSTKSKS